MAHSLKERLISSVTGGVFRSGLSYATNIILARWLGPNGYGEMVFILATFISIRQMLDMGVSSAFYTFISQKIPSLHFIKFYFIWIFCIFILQVIIAIGLIPDFMLMEIWRTDSRKLLFLALLVSTLQQTIWIAVIQIAESQRETKLAQTINILMLIAQLTSIIVVWKLDYLNVKSVLVIMACDWLFGSIILYKICTKRINLPEYKICVMDMLRDYWIYIKPLAVYGIFASLYEFLDKWMMQSWAGADQQGYLSVSQQIVAIALVISTSILRVVWKEFSEAKEFGDELRIRAIYSKISKIIIISTSLIIGFIIPWSLEIIRVTVGKEYVVMEYVLIFIWFYPLFQNIGQLDAILLNATNVTKPNVIIGTIFIILNLIMSILILMPNSILSELNAARNIAIKLVILQYIQTYVRNIFVRKKYSLNNNFFMIFKYVALFLCAGYISKYIAVSLNEFEIYLSALLYLIIFLFIVGSSLYKFKNYFHLTEEFMSIRAKIKNF